MEVDVIALSNGDVTDTANMRRTLFSNLIDRYIKSELDPSSTNYQTRLGQLHWWKEKLGHHLITNITEDLIS
ncbi:MAG: hypothetical protein Tsb0021_05860 [Chlamydiales bacterium]